MAFLAPALPAIGGAVASWGLSKLFPDKKPKGKHGEYLWETQQTPQEKEAYSKMLDYLVGKATSEEWANKPRSVGIPDLAKWGMGIIPGAVDPRGRQFNPMGQAPMQAPVGPRQGGPNPWARAGTMPSAGPHGQIRRSQLAGQMRA